MQVKVFRLAILTTILVGVSLGGQKVEGESIGIARLEQNEESASSEQQHNINQGRKLKQVFPGPETELLCDANGIDCELVDSSTLSSQSSDKILVTQGRRVVASPPLVEPTQTLEDEETPNATFDTADQIPGPVGEAFAAFEQVYQLPILETPETPNLAEESSLSSSPVQECVDVVPPGMFPCEFYVERNLCVDIGEEFCALSCGTCVQGQQVELEDVVACEDIPLPGTTDCQAVLESGLCSNEEVISQGFCLVTCDACGDGLPPDPVAINTPGAPVAEEPEVEIPVVPVVQDPTEPPPPAPLPASPTVQGDCPDIPVPGMADCQAVLDNGLCSNANVVNQGFCQATCGTCPVVPAVEQDSPPPPESPSPPPPLELFSPPPPPVIDESPSPPPPLDIPTPPPPAPIIPSISPSTDGECVDIPLPGMTDCVGIVQSGLCPTEGIVDKGFCLKSCNSCGILGTPPSIEPQIDDVEFSPPPPSSTPLAECEDVLLPGTTSCDVVLENNLCSSDDIVGKGFCLKTCDACPDGVSPTLSPSPSTGANCSAIEAISCDAEGLQALLASYSGSDPCSEQVAGITCDNGRVTSISIGAIRHSLEFDWSKEENPDLQDLSGRAFPAELSKLQFLRTFEAEGTGLSGSIPPEISTLTQMEIFDIDGDAITGPLPAELSTWAAIQWFDVSGQALTGSLPASYSTWRSAQLIDISETSLGGQLPLEWSELNPLLKYFYLYSSGPFTGSVPQEWTQFIGSMEEMYFGVQDQLCIDAVLQLQLSEFSDAEDLNVC